MTEKVNGSTFITSYAFDKDNKPTTITYNRASANTVTQSYDILGRLSGKTMNTGAATYSTTYGYLAGASGSTTTKVGSVTNNGAAISYTYDSNGNISTITNNNQVITYHYNELNEVIREDNQVLNKTITTSYDVGGNILNKVEYPYTTGNLGTATSTINYSYGDSNWKDKLTSYNGLPITYDAIGNPLTYNGWTYSWEEGRQLASMSKTGMNISYKYNDAGIRTEKTVNGVTTKYHLVGGNVTYEDNGTDNIYYTYDSSSNLVSMNLNGVEYYYIRNAQGDIIGLHDNTGAVVVNYTYDTWGKLISTTGSLASTVGIKNPYLYRGYRYDSETGLYYLQSRYYNPDWGRFINADGIVGQTGELLGHNMFAYCKNNPVNMEDNSGNLPKWLSGLASVVIGVGEIMTGLAVAGTGPLSFAGAALLIVHGAGNIVSGITQIGNSAKGTNYDESSFVQKAYEYGGEKLGGKKGKQIGTAVYNTVELGMAVIGTVGGVKSIAKPASVSVVEKTVGEGYRQLGTFKKTPMFSTIVDFGILRKQAVTPQSVQILSGAGLVNDCSPYGYITGGKSAYNSWDSVIKN